MVWPLVMHILEYNPQIVKSILSMFELVRVVLEVMVGSMVILIELWIIQTIYNYKKK